MTLQKFLTSSANPNEVSLTIRSLLVAVVPIMMIVTGLPEADIQPIVDTVVDIVYLAASLLAAIGTCYGLLRKLYHKRWSAV